MDSPLVSVVIPVFNGAKYLRECLQSVVAQRFERWEAVVVNNCSTDATRDIAEAMARRDPRLRVVHCDTFLGQSENYNRALAQASANASYVKLVEADNWISPDCLDRMIAVAQTDPQVGIVGAYYLHGWRLNGAGLPVDSNVVDGAAVCRMHTLENTYFLGTPTTLLFRAQALRALSCAFRPGLFFDDVDLCFRLLRQWKFGFVHQVLAFVRDDNEGIEAQFWDFGFRLPMLWCLIKEYGNCYLTPAERRKMLKETERSYRRQLGRALVTGRSEAYWDFHRQAFRAAGSTLRRRDLAWPALAALLDLLLNPKSTSELIWKHLRMRQRSLPRGVIGDLGK